MTSITWTPEMLARFKVAHKKAVEAHLDIFAFDDNVFAPDYAKYLIQYLEQEFSK